MEADCMVEASSTAGFDIFMGGVVLFVEERTV